MTPAVWTLEQPGRPVTLNAFRRMHHAVWGKLNAATRAEFRLLALAAAIPPLDRIIVTALPVVKGGPLADAGACAPAVKAAIDGLVDAGVIPDDCPAHLLEVRFVAPSKAGRDALVLRIEAS